MDLLGRARRVVQGAIEHADVPFARVVQAARVPRSSAYTPVFQTMMTLQGAYGTRNVDAAMSLDRLEVESMGVRSTAPGSYFASIAGCLVIGHSKHLEAVLHPESIRR